MKDLMQITLRSGHNIKIPAESCSINSNGVCINYKHKIITIHWEQITTMKIVEGQNAL